MSPASPACEEEEEECGNRQRAISGSRHSRAYQSNAGNVFNHLKEIKIGAQATYFDDPETSDVLQSTYDVCMSLGTALGGYRHCCRSAPIPDFERPL